MNISNLRNATISHQKQARTPDGQGGFTVGWSEAASYQGRVNPARALDASPRNGKDAAEISHVVYIIPPLVIGAVKPGERLVVSGRTFEVKIPDVRPSETSYQKIGVLEIQE